MPRYTPEQLAQRNATVWTDVQLILAPIQFVVFLAGVGVTYLYFVNPGIIAFFWVDGLILRKKFSTSGFFPGSFSGRISAALRPELFMFCILFWLLLVQAARFLSGRRFLPTSLTLPMQCSILSESCLKKEMKRFCITAMSCHDAVV